jgi:hypothetical protein
LLKRMMRSSGTPTAYAAAIPPLRNDRGVKRVPGGGRTVTPRRPSAVATTRSRCEKKGVANATAGEDAKSRKNRRQIGSSSPVVGISNDTRGDDPDSPYLKTRNSRLTAAPEMRTPSGDRARTLAGRALIRKPTQTTAQKRNSGVPAAESALVKQKAAAVAG